MQKSRKKHQKLMISLWRCSQAPQKSLPYTLRSRIEAMERQEPVAQVGVHETGGNAGIMWSARPLNEFDSLPLLRDGDRLYLAPGAQPAQMVVAYLDLGVGGYMDIGTDLTDEALAALPKGRHMLGIVGTYGVEGYIQAQPAPSVPDGWLRAIDEALVVAHIGVANESDTYEQAKAKLDSLIGFNVDVATDPAVNGGWKLVPIVSTHKMDSAGSDHCDGYLSVAEAVWDAMIAAAPEAKP
jgi:hypothetical protein